MKRGWAAAGTILTIVGIVFHLIDVRLSTGFFFGAVFAFAGGWASARIDYGANALLRSVGYRGIKNATRC